MTDKITMSVEHSKNITRLKKFKPNKVSKNVGCIAKFQNCAILRFCKENGTKSCLFDEMLNSNVSNETSNKNQNEQKTVAVTRLNKLSLYEDASIKVSETIKEKVQIKNALSVYQFVNIFNLQSLNKTTLRFIERCFTIVSGTESFKQLDYTLTSKILASSSLFITSEIEVFKVADRWLNYNTKERSEYAKDLLLKVRLHLLSNETVKQLLSSSTYFKKDDSCVKFLNKFLDCNKNYVLNKSSIHLSSRYCNQNSYKIVVCGGYDSRSSTICDTVNCIDVNKLEGVEIYPPMITGYYFLKVVYVKGDLFVFGGYNTNSGTVMSVEKYSFTSKTWSQVAETYDDRISFCLCGFMDKIFVIGGFNETSSCLQFDTNDYSWREVARMNEERSNAACAVFEERIVVSGGFDNDYRISNTVESYDVLPNKWSSMPNMNSGKYEHSLVVVYEKLFVISNRRDSCEVFDNVFKMFVTIKSPEQNVKNSTTRAYSIGNKIFVFQYGSPIFICFDTDKNEWSEKPCELTKDLYYFSCVKVPYLFQTTKI